MKKYNIGDLVIADGCKGIIIESEQTKNTTDVKHMIYYVEFHTNSNMKDWWYYHVDIAIDIEETRKRKINNLGFIK